ncbi:tetratricopeptide repeat protein [Atopomonas hussainii]|uniref:tetratricopeptide repeat protein n=1 Tax=Atopomonas hussainii TaxID=1429083 RepID=UPI0009000947|nr:tetratricopeptide repeat protein [Atopomonas hussainii]
MLKKITRLFTLVFSVIGISTTSASGMPDKNENLMLKTGDILIQSGVDGWSAVKILEVDLWPDGTSVAHCLTYKELPVRPTIELLKQAPVLVWHAPIDAGSFGQGWERISNQSPTKAELVGFTEYLKITDFSRYASFTGQDVKEIISAANEHYKRAYALGEHRKSMEAISEYSQAIELFPLFYEAIDNRAFTYMELGKLKEALADFEQSLQVNPGGVAAFFSKGECLMKLGELKAAEEIFFEGTNRFPEQREIFVDFLEKVRTLQKSG